MAHNPAMSDPTNAFTILGMASDAGAATQHRARRSSVKLPPSRTLAGLALAYFVIATEILILTGLARRIPDGLVHVLRLYELFIALCGATHLVGTWAWLGFGHHVAHAFIKLAAAAVSIYTAIVFPRIAIAALKLIYSVRRAPPSLAHM